MKHLAIALAAACVIAGPAPATSSDLRSIAGMQGHDRVLLVFAPTLGDQRLEAQRRTLARFAVGAAQRDLTFVQVAQGRVIGAHDEEERLRSRFAVAPNVYRALLIGKDGHVALSVSAPLDEARLRGAIDAMPMRQEEVRRARAGLGRPQP